MKIISFFYKSIQNKINEIKETTIKKKSLLLPSTKTVTISRTFQKQRILRYIVTLYLHINIQTSYSIGTIHYFLSMREILPLSIDSFTFFGIFYLRGINHTLLLLFVFFVFCLPCHLVPWS